MQYGFIGLGNMGAAIIRGMILSGQFEDDRIIGFDSNKELAGNLGIYTAGSIKELVETADYVILAVKPQVLPNVLPEVKKYSGEKLVISIAAGKTISFLENELGKKRPVIRVMPNINARVLAATSAYCANQTAGKEEKKVVEDIFSSVGSVIELPEKQLAIFSAIAGASPAFTYMYIDALARAACKAGMPKKEALAIASSAVYGSAKMLTESAVHPMQLVDEVCSPGGTTIEGVAVLQDMGFESGVRQAVEAVIAKDEKLGS